MRRLLVLVVLSLAASLSTPTLATSAQSAPPEAASAFSAHGSVNQVYVTGAGVGEELSLIDAGGASVATGTSDSASAYLFREVPAAAGYSVVRTSDSATVTGLAVTTPTDHPTDAAYAAEAVTHPLPAGGYGYLATRDGTTLSINVTMPNDGSTGPWPVVINYSGYDPATPNTTPQEAAVFPFQGYVVVGINMRGTGCSGGAFEFMETLQSTDGYDAVETIAHQSWSNGHIGMVGISYSGYSQLYVGATNPPHLDAITPLSPYSDTYSGILYPGGILNDGFAVDWATERENNAKPAARPWVRRQIANGDTTCADNQQLRLQSKPLLSRIHATPFADHEFDYLNTETFVDKIKVPTYLASQWQDEQTGGSAANLFPLFDPGTKLFASFTNGTHVEPEAPSEIYESMVFIDLYVGQRIPHISGLLYFGAGGELAKIFGSTAGQKYTLPYNPWPQQPSYAAAKATYEAQPRVRVKWENGSVPGSEGEPFSPAVTRFAAWPPPQIQAEKLYLEPDGALGAEPSSVPDAAARASSSYIYDPDTKRDHSFDGKTDQMWAAHPDVHWNTLSEGNALSFLSSPYTKRAAYAGQGSVDLWLRSSATDTDLETTITEVRPDGHEVLIQSGWLRASHRKIEPGRSTELVPYQDHQPADAAPLPTDQFTKVRVELFPFAHVFRPGSRLRLNIEAPGGNQPFWAFETLPGTSVNSIGHSAAMPSRVVLPRLPDADVPPVPEALPACELDGVSTQAVSLRGQPCRSYAPARVPSGVTAAVRGSDIGVTWTAPPGATPERYRVTATVSAGAPPGAIAPDPVEVPGIVTSATFNTPGDGVPLEFTVVALYGREAAPASDASLPVAVTTTPPTTVPPVTEPPVSPLPATADEAFVRRTLTAFTGAALDAEVNAGVAALRAGESRPLWVASLRQGPDAMVNVDPVSRLYLAYLQRVPDSTGLDFWLRRRRSGTTLKRISDQFAVSREFVRTYGALNDAQFVDRIYRNVLGRTADADGAAYWTKQLRSGRRSRGQVMLNFSDSREFRRTAAARIDVAVVYLDLLGRRPTDAELSAATSRLTTGTPLSSVIAEILASPAYAARS